MNKIVMFYFSLSAIPLLFLFLIKIKLIYLSIPFFIILIFIIVLDLKIINRNKLYNRISRKLYNSETIITFLDKKDNQNSIISFFEANKIFNKNKYNALVKKLKTTLLEQQYSDTKYIIEDLLLLLEKEEAIVLDYKKRLEEDNFSNKINLKKLFNN